MAIDFGTAAYVTVDVTIFLVFLAAMICCGADDEPEPQRESQLGQVVVVLPLPLRPRPVAPLVAQVPAVDPPLVMQVPAPPRRAAALPYFLYSQGRESETLVCAICLEQLRHSERCSEVPACCHVFHRECDGSWMKKSSSCPLCRVKIVSRLYDLGARNIWFSGLAPLGCIPSQRVLSDDGECLNDVNKYAVQVNAVAKNLLECLNAKLPGASMSLADSYCIVMELIDHPQKYGFKTSLTSCCDVDTTVWGLCLPTASLCDDRSAFVFWDAYHTSDAAPCWYTRVCRLQGKKKRIDPKLAIASLV